MNAELASTTSLQQPHTDGTNCVITLDSQQYYSYQSDCINIHAPDGTHLECIGHIIEQTDIEIAAARLKEHIFLVECLLDNINHDLKLPAKAVAELADLFYRMQNVCGKYIK